MRYNSPVAPPRRLYLHLGTPKTGTTYLQELLWHHREVLAAHGLHYPGAVPEAHFLAATDLQHVPFNDHEDAAAAGAWERLVEQVRGLSGTVVLSHELFGDASPEQAQRALRELSFTDVHLVVTARDLARQLPAAWQEDLKNRHHWTFARYLTAVRPGTGVRTWFGELFWHRQDVPRVLDRWARTLPPEKVHVVTVPPRGQSTDVLWRRFASVLGVDPGLVDATHELRSNRSLDALEAQLLRRLNRAVEDVVDWPTYGPVVAHLSQEVLGRHDRPRIALPADDHGWAADEAGQLVADLRARGYAVVGDLDELRVGPPPAEPVRHPDVATDSELLEVAVQVLADVLFVRPLPPPHVGGFELARRVATRARRAVRQAGRRVLTAVRGSPGTGGHRHAA